ncbi:hypothetical protein O6H91_21G033400 [Diphasiastrum complanatum]|uniref:Uncharacterized protein n=1 Tax=Diphasiastrum complanatum TaxID=34168 RepID=A0ACC2AJA1_DIPCM|nr:hypothetical protein O6H91_21G033400 [Diphasiastrum complanatum]
MEDLNLGTDAWDWHDESFTLEYQVSRELPPSLWEEFPEENDNSMSIFASTPVADIMELDSVSLPELDDEDISKKTLSAKRRRMLMLCESEEACSSDSVCKSENFVYSQEFYGKHHTYVNDSDISTPSACQLPDAMKYINTVSNPSCMVRRNLELERVKWETICPDKRIQDNCWKQRNMKVHLDDHSSGMWIQSTEPFTEEKRSQILAGTCVTDRSNAAMSTSSPQSSVAYPFALVKPSEAEGNITIRHLNQRISKPHNLRKSKCNLDESCKSVTSEGFGLSGKSIVSLTKIHTEGKGTITIMRTRE